MNGKFFFVGLGLSLGGGLSGICFAGSSMSQSVIYFQGGIVEETCTPVIQSGIDEQSTRFKLEECPALVRRDSIRVQNVNPVGSVTTLDHSRVNVQLIADSGKSGPSYSQQYLLVDSTGKLVSSGAYLITLTAP
ncbi:type 1 fimbrial protein [Pseudomonas sp. EL_65y_Pfl2_R96]|uniref:type 1 fimbrial protein n=1 Tax=Pseudomonas sp. EL_65y_Pfl2_R96 TaxID=3088699 RepID=UPI0030DB0ED7